MHRWWPCSVALAWWRYTHAALGTCQGGPAQSSTALTFLQADAHRDSPARPCPSLARWRRAAFSSDPLSTKAPIRKEEKYEWVVIHELIGFQQTLRTYHFYFCELSGWWPVVKQSGTCLSLATSGNKGNRKPRLSLVYYHIFDAFLTHTWINEWKETVPWREWGNRGIKSAVKLNGVASVRNRGPF